MRKYWVWGCCTSLMVLLSGCSAQTSLSNNSLFKSVSQSERNAVQSVFKTAGYTPKLPTFCPYQIKQMHANEGPGKTNPPTKLQHIDIFMGGGTHTLVEGIFNGKMANLSSQGKKVQLKNGINAYYASNTRLSSLSWNDKDGNSYRLESLKSTTADSSSTKPDLNEQQLVKVAESFQ